MEASSGFRISLGHATLGDALCIPPANHHGDQKTGGRGALFPIVNFVIDHNNS